MPVFEIKLRATPGASKNAVGGVWQGPDGAPRLVVKVTAPPDSGRANKAIIAAIASAFDLPKSSVTLVSGAKTRLKAVTLDGPDRGALEAKLKELLGGEG